MSYQNDKKKFLEETKKLLKLYDVLYTLTIDNVGRFCEFGNPPLEDIMDELNRKHFIEENEDVQKFIRLMAALQFVENPQNKERIGYLMNVVSHNLSKQDSENMGTIEFPFFQKIK